MKAFLDYEIWHNAVYQYLIFLVLFLVVIVVILVARHLLVKRLAAWAARTQRSGVELVIRGIARYLLPAACLLALYLSSRVLYIDAALAAIIDKIAIILVMLLLAMLLSSVVVFFIRRHGIDKQNGEYSELALRWITSLIRAAIWIVAFVLLLDNIGIKINSIIAGLGIGGIAIAFAAQTVISDIFCFFTIVFDKPFVIGDFIVAGDLMGTVEHIGVKTTRLRALSGEQLIFANSDLTKSRIKNYKTLVEKRVVFRIGVTYDTAVEKLEMIPALIRDLIEKIPLTRFGRVHFVTYNAYSLDYEIVYFVLSGDYDQYMDINQAINLAIFKAFGAQGISFAFPTRTLHIEPASTPPEGSPDR